MVKFHPKDRVVDEHMGPGRVVEVLPVGYLVMFDQTPPVRYNGGGNPAFALPQYLSLESSNEEEGPHDNSG